MELGKMDSGCWKNLPLATEQFSWLASMRGSVLEGHSLIDVAQKGVDLNLLNYTKWYWGIDQPLFLIQDKVKLTLGSIEMRQS